MEADGLFQIEVVYATRDRQVVTPLKVAAGTTVAEAIELSGLPNRFGEIEAARVEAGIHGRRVERETVVRAGDRVEIYRPLTADPKQARRRRARRQA